ncbi:MFS transporter [Amycolatopsis sp. NBC_00345]|uniref:MFS transporter n=1 Tax=Amycolatopsis sp. NBC_00345 TaxID=2975955 RepID=UPI002E2650E3
MTPRSRTSLFALLLAAAMMNVAYTMLIPLVPELTGRFGLSPFTLAAAFSGFAFAKALAQPVGGLLVDKVTRLALLGVVGLFATAGSIVGLAFAGDGTQVLVWRLVWGLAEGFTMPVLYRLAAQLGTTTGLGTSRVMGWFGGSAVAGMTIGPALVGLLHGAIGFTGVFLTGAGLTAISAVLLVSIRDTPRPAVDQQVKPLAISRTTAWRLVCLVAIFAVIDFVNNAVFSALEPVLPLHVQSENPGAALVTTSVLYTAGLVMFMIVSVSCARFIESRPLLLVAGVGFGVMTAGLLVISVFGGVVMLWVGFLVFMATQPVLYVVARQGVSQLPAHRLGRAYGAFGMVSDIGFIVGPLVGVALYERFTGTTFGLLAIVTGLAAGAALLARRLPARLTGAEDESPAAPVPGR